jgi:hypothetical protein
MGAAVKQLHADGFNVRDEDAVRLSRSRGPTSHARPLLFQLPDLPGGLRPLPRQEGPPTRHDRENGGGPRGEPLPDYRCSA